MAEQKSCSTFLTFMVGAAIGGGLAYLFAPRSGAETRAQIRQTADDVRNRVQQLAEETENRIMQAVDQSRSAYEERKAALQAAAEAGREAYRETKDATVSEEARQRFESEVQTPGQA